MKIERFNGEYRWLSNFHPCAKGIWFDGAHYSTAEHAFQAAKTLNLNEKELIRNLRKPGEAKRMGREITLREDWEKMKILIMTRIVKNKFFQNPELAKLLLQTGDAELIEGNTWNDTFWGVCNGVGENWLGKILMKVRESLKLHMTLYETRILG